MEQLQSKSVVDDVVEALIRDTGTIDLQGNAARLFLRSLQELAHGKPLNQAAVARIAKSVGLTMQQAEGVLNWLAERNDAGDIVGLAGLSLNQWSHRFRVKGHDFTTWCALDTLYLPQALQEAAEVETKDPVTGETIEIRVGKHGAVEAPDEAVISIVVPKVDEKGIESAEQIWNMFCSYSLYFSSVERAREWFQEKAVKPVFLTAEQGFELGGKWFAQVLSYADA